MEEKRTPEDREQSPSKGQKTELKLEDARTIEFDVLYYHHWCHDGTAAAAIYLKYCAINGIKKPRKEAIGHAKFAVPREEKLLFVDIVPDNIEELRGKTCFFFDHHEKAAQVDGFPVCYSKEKSAARIVWDFFFPGGVPIRGPCGTMYDRVIPPILQVIEDRDLGKEQTGTAAAISKYLWHVEKPSVERMGELLFGMTSEAGYKRMEEIGAALIKQLETEIQNKLKFALLIGSLPRDGDQNNRIPVAFVQGDVNASDAAKMYFAQNPMGPDVFIVQTLKRENGEFYNSFSGRSRNDVDLNALFSQFEHNGVKGGGHKGAAAFKTHAAVHPLLFLNANIN